MNPIYRERNYGPTASQVRAQKFAEKQAWLRGISKRNGGR